MLNELYQEQSSLMDERKLMLRRRRYLEQHLTDEPPVNDYAARLLFNQRVDKYNMLMDELEETTSRINNLREQFNDLLEEV